MTSIKTQYDLLKELEPIAAENLNRHLRQAKNWNPHDFTPWSDGFNFAAMGGNDWDPNDVKLSEVARASLITNLLTEDNLPSYHREISQSFSLDDAWGAWVGRWTAEENRHSIAIRDYLLTTRTVDPVQLERDRIVHMTNGFSSLNNFGLAEERVEPEMEVLYTNMYVTFQELATRVSHRNTAKVCGDKVAEQLLAKVASDENLHMLFYRNIGQAALDLVPDKAMKAVFGVIYTFVMPGSGMPNFRRNGVLMAKHAIYDLRQHVDEVIMPVLRKWRIFERNDFGPQGEDFREKLADHMEELSAKAEKFEETRQRLLARDRAKGLIE